jgi:mono/diheme cytochrome c family protein
MWYPRKGMIAFGLVGFILLAVGTVQHVMGAGNVEAGGKLYQTRCSPCHGPDGKAATPTAQALTPKPRDHTDGAYMNQLSNEHIAKVIKNGGPAVGKSPIMPAHTDLNDQQIEDVIAFVRTLAVPPYSGK